MLNNEIIDSVARPVVARLWSAQRLLSYVVQVTTMHLIQTVDLHMLRTSMMKKSSPLCLLVLQGANGASLSQAISSLHIVRGDAPLQGIVHRQRAVNSAVLRRR